MLYRSIYCTFCINDVGPGNLNLTDELRADILAFLTLFERGISMGFDLEYLRYLKDENGTDHRVLYPNNWEFPGAASFVLAVLTTVGEPIFYFFLF